MVEKKNIVTPHFAKEEFCPGRPDRDGMRSLTAGTLAAFFSGTLQGNVSALSVLNDTSSTPVPTEGEMK